MAVLEITNENFDEQVINSDKPVLVDFWASWCGPCKVLSPVVDEISEENENIKVCKVNIDEEPELARRYGIMSIPTLLFFKGGQLIDKSIGVVPKSTIISMIEG